MWVNPENEQQLSSTWCDHFQACTLEFNDNNKKKRKTWLVALRSVSPQADWLITTVTLSSPEVFFLLVWMKSTLYSSRITLLSVSCPVLVRVVAADVSAAQSFLLQHRVIWSLLFLCWEEKLASFPRSEDTWCPEWIGFGGSALPVKRHFSLSLSRSLTHSHTSTLPGIGVGYCAQY